MRLQFYSRLSLTVPVIRAKVINIASTIFYFRRFSIKALHIFGKDETNERYVQVAPNLTEPFREMENSVTVKTSRR